MAIPPQVLYDSVKPIGYPTQTKIMRFSPQTGQGNIQPNDIVRFNFSTSGYWDPSTVYISMTVQLDPSFRKYDAIQIDGSASSFISEFIATCKGVELERIQEYDQLANILEDLNYSNEQRFCRDIQGLGNNSRASTKSWGAHPTSTYGLRSEGEFRSLTSLAAPKYFYQGWNPFTSTPANFQQESVQRFYDNTDPYLIFNSTRKLDPALVINNVIRTTQTPETVNPFLPQMILFKNILGMPGPIRTFPNSNNNTTEGVGYHSTLGCHDIINNDLTQGCFEPVLCRGLGLNTMIDGRLQAESLEKRTFAIPLYSGIFGQLMEKHDLKYLPMSALQDLMLEFRINPFAVFTSGYSYLKAGSDTVEDSYSAVLTSHAELQRKFVITKFEIVCEMLSFDARVDTLIQNQLSSSDGVIFPTQSWMLGPIFSLPAGQVPSGNYQLNMGFESLKKICITFLSPTTKPFQRKLGRFSGGITSLQLRIGMELYPSQPIKGHSGTAGGTPTTYIHDNNNEYLIALYKAFGKFNNYDEDCSINSVNFALNIRHSDATMGSGGNLWVSDADRTMLVSSFNAFGLPLLHQNLMKGKAIYALDLEGLGDDKRVTSGLNTNLNRPIEIVFTGDSSNPASSPFGFTLALNMYIWCHYDMVVKFTKFSAQVMGRGI